MFIHKPIVPRGIMLKNRSVYSLVVSGTSLAKLSAYVGEHYFQNTAGLKRKDTGRPKCNVVHRKVCQHLLRTMCTRHWTYRRRSVVLYAYRRRVVVLYKYSRRRGVVVFCGVVCAQDYVYTGWTYRGRSVVVLHTYKRRVAVLYKYSMRRRVVLFCGVVCAQDYVYTGWTYVYIL